MDFGEARRIVSDSPLAQQRQKWFRTEMEKAKPTFTHDKELSLFAGTWNVNGRGPDLSVDLSPWLFPNPNRPCDIFMIGLQEVQALSGVDALRTDFLKGNRWRIRIATALGSDYDQVAERQLVGIMVLVFMRKNHIPYLSEVLLSSAATGFMNTIGNKGGVAARFRLYDKSIACVACHLAAHTAYVDRRNQDFRDVSRRAVFPIPSSDNENDQDLLSGDSQPVMMKHKTSLGEQASGLPTVATGTGTWLGSVASVAAMAVSEFGSGMNSTIPSDVPRLEISSHDVVFWLGDLNYRVEAPVEDVLNWITEKNWNALMGADQLQKQMSFCDAFEGFNEGKIFFPPTFKFERYRDEYARDENGEIKRTPSYTDRILWKIREAESGDDSTIKIKQRRYESAPVFSSDHRPVYGIFSMVFGVEDVGQRINMERKINKDLDQREASYRPALQFSSRKLDFGDVFYERQCDRSLTIRNQGGVSTYLSISLPQKSAPWLRFDSTKMQNIEILPRKAIGINISVLVNSRDGTANLVSKNGCSLESVLVINAEPGEFSDRIPIQGRYVATTLGMSLETLVMQTEPVLALRTLARRGEETGAAQSRYLDNERTKPPGGTPLPIPKEIWLLCDALQRNRGGNRNSYLNTCTDLFLREVTEEEQQRVLAFVDRAEVIPDDISGHAIAQCLLQVLRCLEESVIPRAIYRRAIEAGYTKDPDSIHAIVEFLPPLHANVFWYLIAMLCEIQIVQEKHEKAKEIFSCFGDVLLRFDESARTRDARHRSNFVALGVQRFLKDPKELHSVVFDLSNPTTHPKRVHRIING